MGRRLPIGPLVAALGAVLLLVSLFLDWYADITAWTTFEVLDLVLAALALATLAALARELGLDRRELMRGGLLLPLGALAFLVVLSQILNHPPAANGKTKEIGVWLALGGGAAMLAGAFLASARISLALDVERREPADRTEPTRPAPPGPPAG